MTLSEADRKWREERLAKGTARKAKRGGGGRFAPLNALVDGGWLKVLTQRELEVWVVLFRMADARSLVTVSHGRLARDAGIRRENAARTTKQLERYGLLRVRVRGRTVGRAGKRTSNEYELLVPEPCPNSATSGTIEEPE